MEAAFFLLEPEVAGGLGERTVMDTASHPPKVEHLHYELEGWLGDDLLESFPAYVVTRTMGDRLVNAELDGFTLRHVEISRSSTFEELYPSRDLPAFTWLDVSGVAGESDVGVDPKARLVVSGRAMVVLRGASLDNCLITDWPSESGE